MKWIAFTLLPRSNSSKATSADPASQIKPTTIEVLRPSKDLLESSYLSYFSSSEDVHRVFCGKCGTHLSFHYSGADDDKALPGAWGPHFDIALGTFDKESLEMEGIIPARQAWYDDGISWVQRLLKDGEKSLHE